MRSYFLIGAVALIISGCTGSCMQWKAQINGYTKLCIDGYSWVFVHGDYAQQQLDENGPVKCK